MLRNFRNLLSSVGEILLLGDFEQFIFKTVLHKNFSATAVIAGVCVITPSSHVSMTYALDSLLRLQFLIVSFHVIFRSRLFMS